MSLTKTSVLAVAKTQYHYKTKVNVSLFFSLIAMQLLAFLFSFNGTVGSSGGGGNYGASYTINYVTGDVIIFFTLIWAFSIGISVAKAGLKADFTFVSNRLSSHLSNLAFIVTAAVIAGLTATLCGIVLRIVVLFTYEEVVTGPVFWIAPSTLLSGILAAMLYALLLSIIGYLVGMLIQRHPAFFLLLPGLFFGILFMDYRNSGQGQVFIRVTEFFSTEASLALLTLKIILVSAIIFGCVLLFFNRMEVRK